ncbi:hypothetical protein [Pseudomonas sp. RT6P73]
MFTGAGRAAERNVPALLQAVGREKGAIKPQRQIVLILFGVRIRILLGDGVHSLWWLLDSLFWIKFDRCINASPERDWHFLSVKLD